NLLPPDIQLSQIRRRLDLFRIHGHALRTYRPQRYAGRITLFQAVQRLSSEQHHPAQDWSTLAAEGVEMYTVPGDHYAILRHPMPGYWRSTSAPRWTSSQRHTPPH